MRKIQIDVIVYAALGCALAGITPGRAQSKIGSIQSVQEDRVQINLGRLDGLHADNEGSIYFEILVGGEKKEVPVATFRVITADTDTSQAQVLSPTGPVRPGYRVRLTNGSPPTADALLAQGDEHFQAGEFETAIRYYQKIAELIPDDLLTRRRIIDCQRQIADKRAREKERERVAYYRTAMKIFLEEKNQTAAVDYAERILRVLPEDAEARAVLAQKAAPVLSFEVRSTPVENTESLTPARAAPGAAAIDWSRMELVPGATVTIGENREGAYYHNEQPAHTVTVPPFYLDKYEVTNAEYQRFVEATRHRPPPYWKGGTYPKGLAEYPVVQVTWDDVQAYAEWAGKRLPTEAEWELAARGTDRRPWPWGWKTAADVSNTRPAQRKGPAPVGSYPGDRSAFGIFDMGGNVSEWTADWYKPYPGNNQPEKDYGERYKVLRGGSFNSDLVFARGAFRAHLPRDYKASDLGFRCAMDPPKTSPGS